MSESSERPARGPTMPAFNFSRARRIFREVEDDTEPVADIADDLKIGLFGHGANLRCCYTRPQKSAWRFVTVRFLTFGTVLLRLFDALIADEPPREGDTTPHILRQVPHSKLCATLGVHHLGAASFVDRYS